MEGVIESDFYNVAPASYVIVLITKHNFVISKKTNGDSSPYAIFDFISHDNSHLNTHINKSMRLLVG